MTFTELEVFVDTAVLSSKHSWPTRRMRGNCLVYLVIHTICKEEYPEGFGSNSCPAAALKKMNNALVGIVTVEEWPCTFVWGSSLWLLIRSSPPGSRTRDREGKRDMFKSCRKIKRHRRRVKGNLTALCVLSNLHSHRTAAILNNYIDSPIIVGRRREAGLPCRPCYPSFRFSPRTSSTRGLIDQARAADTRHRDDVARLY